ncbi:ComEA family DNA-binding protein [Butyrivibrio sp. AE2032]|uniref:ComEA family DNA-binding protein n=1 Tax=Butyrivibrio sp. AE2032 TaxID=1458463 RepID=UPI000691B5DB|nr:ComEA family DNA-binding protein [Butyrivibrio sp. AE2032]
MLKKSTTAKIKKMIYPAAFILIVILSAVYKLVFKGNADVPVTAFKSGKTAMLASESTDEKYASEIAVGSETAYESALETADETAVTIQKVSVYICGEINRPGIYEAPKGVMLNSIIEDAGGLTDNASADYINLVYQIECNMSIYIPSADEIRDGFTGGDIIRQDGVYVWGTSQGADGGQGSSGSEGNTLMVNINTATAEELKSLPGIGDVTAQAIVDYRKNNPFKTIEDIRNVSGIGDSKYNRIKDYICV